MNSSNNERRPAGLFLVDFSKALGVIWLLVEVLSYFVDPFVRYIKPYGWAVPILCLFYAALRLLPKKDPNMPRTRLGKIIWTFVALVSLCLLTSSLVWGYGNTISMWLSFLLLIFSASALATQFSTAIWLANVLKLLALPVAVFVVVHEPLEDWYFRFEKTDKNAIKVLMADLGGNDIIAAKALTTEIYTKFVSRYSFNKVKIDQTLGYETGLHANRTNRIWTSDEMRARGKRRGADIGVVGDYEKQKKANAKVYHVIKGLQFVILDDSLKRIFESETPLYELYEFCVDPDMISFLSDSVAQLINYVGEVAVNSRLLKEAMGDIDRKKRSKILKYVNDSFVRIGISAGLPAVSVFHLGNSYFHSAIIASNDYDRMSMYLKADSAYQECIRQPLVTVGVMKVELEKPYFNMAITRRQLFKLTNKVMWNDSTEIAYQRAAEKVRSYRTIEEFVKFLDERLTREYDELKLGASIPSFPSRCRKILDWTKTFENKIQASDLSRIEKKTRIEEIIEMRSTWKARLDEYH